MLGMKVLGTRLIRHLGTMALFLAPLTAPAQEIRGVVMDPGTNHGIEAAEVTIRKMPPRVIGQPIRAEEAGKLKTDAQGSFVFLPDEFAEYVLTVQKEGFSALMGVAVGIPSTQINVIVDKERPTREVRFLLGRPGEITGRLVDYDTRAPIPNFRVLVSPLLYTRGLRILWAPFVNAVTDAEGRFRASDLSPSQYLAQIGPQLPEKEMFLREFSAADAAAIDQDYEKVYFPGGPDLDAALPVPLASGASVDVGTLRARKISHYRVRVSVSSANCALGTNVRLLLFFQSYLGGATGVASGETECGKEALFRNIAPGNYMLSARAGTSPAQRVHAEVPIAVTNGNETVRVTLAKGSDIRGRLMGVEGARKFDWGKIQVSSSVMGSAWSIFSPPA